MGPEDVPQQPERSAEDGGMAAELRLLPLLPTHLTLEQIAERLYLTRNTVKTQAASVYRKFGVNSRGEAVIRMRDLGLMVRSAN